MNKLIIAALTLAISFTATAGIQDKRIANHVKQLKEMNHDFCLAKFPKSFCDDMDKSFDGMVEMILMDGRIQGLREAKKRASK